MVTAVAGPATRVRLVQDWGGVEDDAASNEGLAAQGNASQGDLPASLDHQQEHLRGRQPAPHQHRQQPPPLRRHPAHQRRARRADRAEDARHQPPPGDGADRRLQERPRQRLHQDAALLRPALHRQQPRQTPSTSPTTTPATSPSTPTSASCPIYQFAGRGQQEDHPPRRLRREVPRQVHARPDDQPLHGARRQRAEAADDAAVPDLCRQGTSSTASTRTAATATSGTPPAAARRSPPSRPPRCSRTTPTSKSASSSSTARTSTARPARSSTASRKAASRKTPTPAPSSAACSPTTTPTRSSSPPSRSSASRWTKTASATSRTSQGQPTYKEQLEPLRDKRMVFIFDECHRSQFGDNHKAIKEFFPNSVTGAESRACGAESSLHMAWGVIHPVHVAARARGDRETGDRGPSVSGREPAGRGASAAG